MAYPTDEPALVRGQAYRVLVLEPDADPDIASGPLNSGFKVMSEAQAQEAIIVLREVDSKQGIAPSDHLAMKVRARLLAGLNAEAIEPAEGAGKGATAAAAVAPMLGAAWLRTGCSTCGISILEKSFEAASASRDAYVLEEFGSLLKGAYKKANRLGLR